MFEKNKACKGIKKLETQTKPVIAKKIYKTKNSRIKIKNGKLCKAKIKPEIEKRKRESIEKTGKDGIRAVATKPKLSQNHQCQTHLPKHSKGIAAQTDDQNHLPFASIQFFSLVVQGARGYHTKHGRAVCKKLEQEKCQT